MSRIADRRLWFTADKSELVEDGDQDAAFLAATPGRPVPDVPVRSEQEPKQAEPPANKAEAAPANKSRTTSRKPSKKDD